MKLIKVGAAVLNQTPLDWAGNRRRILEAIELAAEQEVTLLCLPELCITGHGCEDAFQSPSVQDTALEVLAEIAPATAGRAVALGLPLMVRKALFDTVALLVDGRLTGFVAKRHLAGDGLYYEPRWFKPWPKGHATTVQIGDEEVPLGDLIFDVDGVQVGFEICEDAWVARRPGIDQAARGADVILNPSASHFAFGKHRIRHRFVLEGSRAFGVSYVYANLLGNESGRMIFDGGALIASGGRLLAAGPRFGFEEVALTCAQIDVDETRMLQARTGSHRPDLSRSDRGVVRVDFSFPRPPVEPSPPVVAPGWQESEHSKEEAFTRAVTLALWDYLRKSRSRGFVVSLSGGADSSAVSCLVALMVRRLIREVGESVLEASLPGLLPEEGADGSPAAGGERERAWIHALLLCVYQSTRNSSDTTRNAARGLAEALGAEFHELDVDALVVAYEGLVEGALGRALSWETDDLARQNIQARVRSPGIWMLANLRRALLLSTSNRSEAAVGYATMDGDTSGGLSPIAGIDKAFLRRWLRWLETRGPEDLGPIAALDQVNVQAPTAELRPSESGQTDEQDLMPYDLLDAIERAAIRDKKGPVEVFHTLMGHHPDHDAHQMARWVERFFRLWCRNQWKRERYAPSFHVDDENLDPKTWCRFPILSGGFERELDELRTLVGTGVDP